MNGKDISHALSGLPEDMIAEAMAPARKSRTIPWLRIAVCFAAVLAVAVLILPTSNDIVTAPGILVMKVYASDNSGESIIISEPFDSVMELPYNYYYCPAVNCVPGVPIVLSIVDRDNVSFEVTAHGGGFIGEELIEGRELTFIYEGQELKNEGAYRYIYLQREFVMENESCIYWRPFYLNPKADIWVGDVVYADSLLWQRERLCQFATTAFGPWYDRMPDSERAGDVAYADVLIRQDDHIIGFALIAFDAIHDEVYGFQGWYAVRLAESVFYPPVGGKYQKITEEYVREQIQKVKDKDLQAWKPAEAVS